MNKSNYYNKKKRDYEKEIIDVDELEGTDIKINPEYYIHNALIKAQEALTNDNTQEGFVQYRVLIEHIETLCRAAQMIPPDYEANINEYSKSEEVKNEQKPTVRSVKIATRKLQELMSVVFANKVITDPLKA